MRLTVIILTIMTAAAAADENVARGHKIAQANCSRCHAIGSKGESPSPAAPPFQRLAERYPLENLEEALAEGIVVGHGGLEMPRFQFAPEQIDALIAYLATIQRK